MADCIICKEPLENGEIVTLGEECSASVNRASVERNDDTVSTVPDQQSTNTSVKSIATPTKYLRLKDCPYKIQTQALATLYSVQRKRALVSTVIVSSVEHQSVMGNKRKKETSLKLQPLA